MIFCAVHRVLYCCADAAALSEDAIEELVHAAFESADQDGDGRYIRVPSPMLNRPTTFNAWDFTTRDV